MAIFLPSPVIGAISGNLGGACFVLSKSGPVIRQRIRRTRQGDARHAQMRAAVQRFRIAWRDLSEEQRTSWRQSAISFPFTNRLGVTSTLSGFQLFMKLNLFTYDEPNIGILPLIETPPNLTAFAPFRLDSFEPNQAGGPILFFSNPSGGPTQSVSIFGARSFSSAPRLFWNSYKALGRETPSLTKETDITNWTSILGPIRVGERYFVRVFLRTPTGFPTGPQDVSAFGATGL